MCSSDLLKPADPTWEGHNFLGWDTEVPATMPASDLNVKALWEMQTFVIRFFNFDNELLDEQEVEYGVVPEYAGETPVRPENDEYTYTFIGWDIEAENITGDTNCHAQFRYIGRMYKRLLDGGVLGPLEVTAATVLGGYALAYFATATSISMPNVVTVGEYAFATDSSTAIATEISLPLATTIGNYAFHNQNKLESVELPLAQTIGSSAFSNCTSLVTLSLPEATSLGSSAFSGCTALESVSLPKVTQLVNYTFLNTNSLVSIQFSDSLTRIGTFTFYNCPALEELTIPASVTTIDVYMAGSQIGLKRLIFLGKPTTISSQAFTYCTGLEDIYVPWEEGQVPYAPWGAANATVHYVDEGWQEELLPEPSGE